MIAQQLLRLVQELAFVLGSRTFITPPQLPQKLYACQFTHCFIHSGQSNPTFGATYPFTALSSPFRVTILLAQFAPRSSYLCAIVSTSQIRTLLSRQPPAISLPFGEKVKLPILSDFKLPSDPAGSTDSSFQNLIGLSRLPLTRNFPSCEKASDQAAPTLPRHVLYFGCIV